MQGLLPCILLQIVIKLMWIICYIDINKHNEFVSSTVVWICLTCIHILKKRKLFVFALWLSNSICTMCSKDIYQMSKSAMLKTTAEKLFVTFWGTYEKSIFSKKLSRQKNSLAITNWQRTDPPGQHYRVPVMVKGQADYIISFLVIHRNSRL